MVGLQALNEGVSPHKTINPSPEDEDYKIITQSALLLANNVLQNEAKNGKLPKIILTTGFPYATFQLNKDAATEYFKEEKIVTYSKAEDDGSQKSEHRVISVHSVNIIPELIGCDTAVRKGENPEEGNYILISLGYGTCEGALSTPDGLSARTLFSTHGISYAINLFTQELNKHTYLQLRTEHQIDHLFTKGFMFVNRKRKDFHEEKKVALEMYYNNVISPAIRRYISDADFEASPKIILAGGGAHHKDLTNLFHNEFSGFLSVSIFENPEKCASMGYSIYSKLSTELVGKDKVFNPDEENTEKTACVGVDIGNANTCVSIINK